MREDNFGNDEGSHIQFLHANAYTPGCYQQLFAGLNEYKITTPFQRPLWQEEPPSDYKSWHLFRDDLIRHMDEYKYRNVIGVGHSLGGIVSWLAAIERPDLFKQLILIDPVILPKFPILLVSYLPYSIQEKRVPIVSIAARRKNIWPTKEAAKEYFLSKKFFQRFDLATQQDFLNFGLKQKGEEQTLAYPRIWEAKVYGSAPNMWPLMKHTPCPITIIRAQYSDVISDATWKKIKAKLKNGNFTQIDNAGHLVPFEKPQLCAEIIKDLIL